MCLVKLKINQFCTMNNTDLKELKIKLRRNTQILKKVHWNTSNWCINFWVYQANHAQIHSQEYWSIQETPT